MSQPDEASQTQRSDLLVAFDADDTLWHNEIYYRNAGEKFKRLLGRHRDPDQVERALAEMEVRNIRWFGYGFKSYTLSMIETAVALTGGQIAAHEIETILRFGREMLDADVLLFEHARAALISLFKHHDLMLITKGDLFEQHRKLSRSGLADFFKYTEIIPEKSSHAYQAILDRHAISPDRFVMVGNSLKSDILPVLEIGARAVFVPYEHTWANEHADGAGHTYHEIEHLGQLPELIASME